MLDQILSYREMCDTEGVQTLQRGMNFRMKSHYSLILMSRRANAPYKDRILDDGVTIEYEGHDAPRTSYSANPKQADQPFKTEKGQLTQNGYFVKAVEKYKQGLSSPELVKVYEKIIPGVWSLRGYFHLIDYRNEVDSKRQVFIFTLKLAETQNIAQGIDIDIRHTRLIPTEIKKEVWHRDKGQCVLCRSNTNLHFDHDLPYSKGGASFTVKNIRLLCAKCNLTKSNKIE